MVADRADRDDIKWGTITEILIPRTRDVRCELELANGGPEKGPPLLPRLQQDSVPQGPNRQKGHTRQPRPAPDIEEPPAVLEKRSRRQRIENMALHELLAARKAHQVMSFGPALKQPRIANQPL
jgi:hypothetical protein